MLMRAGWVAAGWRAAAAADGVRSRNRVARQRRRRGGRRAAAGKNVQVTDTFDKAWLCAGGRQSCSLRVVDHDDDLDPVCCCPQSKGFPQWAMELYVFAYFPWLFLIAYLIFLWYDV
jgi:hypothetical protein